MRNYTSQSTFKAVWCGGILADGVTVCGHSFDNEYQRSRDGQPGVLITAAARYRRVNQYGEATLHFLIVDRCPKCGAECNQEWADNCLLSAPEQPVYGRDD